MDRHRQRLGSLRLRLGLSAGHLLGLRHYTRRLKRHCSRVLLIITVFAVWNALIKRNWFCDLLKISITQNFRATVLHSRCCWRAHYFDIGLILNRSGPWWIISFNIPRYGHRTPTELLLHIRLLLCLHSVSLARCGSPIPSLLIVQFLRRLQVLLKALRFKLLTREDQLVISARDFLFLCVSLSICLFPDLFLFFSRVQDFALDLPSLKLLLLLAFILLFPLLRQIEQCDRVCDESFLYLEVQRGICCETRSVVYFNDPWLQLFV